MTINKTSANKANREKIVTLVLRDGNKIKAERPLNYVSATIRELLAVVEGMKVEVPVDLDEATPASVTLLNACINLLHEKIPNELREKAAEREYWVENIVSFFLSSNLALGC